MSAETLERYQARTAQECEWQQPGVRVVQKGWCLCHDDRPATIVRRYMDFFPIIRFDDTGEEWMAPRIHLQRLEP